ncbi:hypothetical protein H4S14_002607 [Agrobacterium vitis]|nr:hypothetical protein [Agrobacterium vitis]MBE1438850.1 hypothetical protein [Agrobacterium vitis]
MIMTLPSATSQTVTLSSPLTIRTVEATKDVILAGFSATGSLIVDVPDDAECDLSFVQLMESARMLAQTDGKDFTLQRPASGGLLSVLERGGFLTETDPSDRFFWLHERQL